MKVFLLIVWVCFSQIGHAKDKSLINFAPLPTHNSKTNIKQFLSMTNYLEDKLDIDINYIYKNSYTDILQGFNNQTIDIAYLGPLPLVTLINKYADAEPIVVFKNKKSNSYQYRCVLAKFKKDTFDKNQVLKVALTQPLSTCGYFMTSKLLQDKFDIDLSQQKYHYAMSHSNALLAVLKGEFLLAGAKESIAKQYEVLGMEIIARSELIPGFSLVVNKKTLSKHQIDAIRHALISISQEDIDSWEEESISGMKAISAKDYESLNIGVDIPQQGNIK